MKNKCAIVDGLLYSIVSSFQSAIGIKLYVGEAHVNNNIYHHVLLYFDDKENKFKKYSAL